MNIIEARPCPLESISSNSGSIAAFAKWNKTAQVKKIASRRSFNRCANARGVGWVIAVVRPACHLVVDFIRLDARKCPQRRNREGYDEKENAAIRKEIPDETHRDGCDNIPCGIEGLITPLSPVEQFSTDQAERDRHHCRAKHALTHADERLSRHHEPKGRIKCDHQRAYRKSDNSARDQCAFGSNTIPQGTGGRRIPTHGNGDESRRPARSPR